MPLIQWIMQNLDTARVQGVVAGGSADVAKIISLPTIGGVVGGGSSIETIITITQGGVIVGGSAILGESFITTRGGVLVGGQATITFLHSYDETGSGGVIVGGQATVFIEVIEECHKYLLPRHPKPSTADYRPQNIAPLIEFFTPIIAGALGQSVDKCQVTFHYENNTPCNYADDIFVKHPTCIGQAYNPEPRPTQKSDALKKYEQYAKKSSRLKNYMLASPARIEYFRDQ